MAIQKNFVVKNGLEVSTNLILANATTDRVGIGSTNPRVKLDVRGGIAATDLNVSGVTTVQSLTINGTLNLSGVGVGTTGQYLKSTYTGVSWDYIRKVQTYSATEGQTVFSFTHTPNQIDVYVNGVKIGPSQYTETSSNVTLTSSAFSGDFVELIEYGSDLRSGSSGGTSSRELSQFAPFVQVNSSKRIGFTTDLNVTGVLTATTFYGDGSQLTGITAVAVAGGGNKQIQFNNSSAISGSSQFFYDNTTNNVGIATSIPTSKLQVIGNVSVNGILTATTGSFTRSLGVNLNYSGISTVTSLVGTNLNYGGISTITSLTGTNLNYTGVSTISNGRLTNLNVSGVSTFTSGPILVGGASSTGTPSQRLQVTGGAYINGNLGVSEVNPTSRLYVSGDTFVTGVITATTFSGNIPYASVSGVSTSVIGGIGSISLLRVSGISTFSSGPVLISNTGTATSTGTASQPLQVTGGAYVSGSVGIGTTLPAALLHVNNTSLHGAPGDALLRLVATGGASYVQSGITATSGSSAPLIFTNIFAANEWARFASTGQFLIGSSTLTGTASQPFQVTGGGYVSGNLGVGNTNPQYKLDVNGNLNFDGNLYQNGSLFVASKWTVGDGDNIYRLSGNVGIATTNPTSKLHVLGNVLVSGIVTSSDYNSTSDIKLKENIKPIENSIDKILKINGVTFDWKETKKPSIGVIAQNIEEVFPELVNGEETKTVNYNGLIGVLIEAVKELSSEVQNLKDQLNK